MSQSLKSVQTEQIAIATSMCSQTVCVHICVIYDTYVNRNRPRLHPPESVRQCLFFFFRSFSTQSRQRVSALLTLSLNRLQINKTSCKQTSTCLELSIKSLLPIVNGQNSLQKLMGCFIFSFLLEVKRYSVTYNSNNTYLMIGGKLEGNDRKN